MPDFPTPAPALAKLLSDANQSAEQSKTTTADITAPEGLFVVFEGGDGVGKTTQAKLLESWFVSRNLPTLHTREPGGTALGKQLRELLLAGENISPRTEALLFAADRSHHVDSVIKPAIAQGIHVICDRYIDSSIAYQAGGRGLDAELIEQLSLWGTEHLVPHLTVVLDLPVDVARARRKASRTLDDRIESENTTFHERIRQTFLNRAALHPERYLVLNAASPAEEILESIVQRIMALRPSYTGIEKKHP